MIDLFDQTQPQVDYNAVSIASPEVIRSWSQGEVKRPERLTIVTIKVKRRSVLRKDFRTDRGLGMLLR